MDLKKTVKEWFVPYIRNRDVVQKAISEIEENADGYDLFVRKATGDVGVVILPHIDVLPVDKLSGRPAALVVLNTRENLEKVIAAWAQLVKNPKLTIYFVNPKSEGEQKWVLVPATHEFVAEKAALKIGLFSLFESVPTWSE